MGEVADRFANVRERAELAYRRVRGSSDGLRIVCVTKMQPLPRVLEVIEAGATDIGENYLQEAAGKGIFELRQSHEVTIRYIGRLQSNKYNAILRDFDTVDSADPKLLGRVHAAGRTGMFRAQTFLLEVNAGGEPQKAGLTIAQVRDLALAHNPALDEISGLMAVVPLEATEEVRAGMYDAVSLLFQDLTKEFGPSRIKTLSMGTSDDFELAILHGSNMIRVGTAIFGPRASGPS